MSEVIVDRLGISIPSRLMANDDMVNSFLSTGSLTAEKIEGKTGINQRYYMDTEIGENLVSMAVRAVLNAMQQKNAFKVDALFYVGVSPPADYVHKSDIFYSQEVNPTNISLLTSQTEDIMAKLRDEDSRFADTKLFRSFGGCAGLISAMIKAHDQIKNGQIETAMVVCVTDISRCLDPGDESTAILFGDGACALLLRAGDTFANGRIIAHYEDINQELDHLLFYQKAGDRWFARMPNGGQVFRAALTAIMDKCMPAMKDQGFSIDMIDHFIFHQANGRILDSIAHRCGISSDKMHKTIKYYGNTSAASIGISWFDAISRQKKIKQGDLVFLCSFGAGFKTNFMIVQY
jgi:3-oxoacyl-(acyl-carrier-protein) synthase III